MFIYQLFLPQQQRGQTVTRVVIREETAYDIKTQFLISVGYTQSFMHALHTTRCHLMLTTTELGTCMKPSNHISIVQ